MPVPEKLERVPPVAVTSLDEKSVDDSLSVNVTRAVSPLLREGLLVVIATVGAVVSMEIGAERAAAMLPLPTPSVNEPAATEIDPAVVELALGVKVAT